VPCRLQHWPHSSSPQIRSARTCGHQGPHPHDSGAAGDQPERRESSRGSRPPAAAGSVMSTHDGWFGTRGTRREGRRRRALRSPGRRTRRERRTGHRRSCTLTRPDSAYSSSGAASCRCLAADKLDQAEPRSQGSAPWSKRIEGARSVATVRAFGGGVPRATRSTPAFRSARRRSTHDRKRPLRSGELEASPRRTVTTRTRRRRNAGYPKPKSPGRRFAPGIARRRPRYPDTKPDPLGGEGRQLHGPAGGSTSSGSGRVTSGGWTRGGRQR